MTTGAAAYTRTAIALHWIAAVLIVCGFSMGLWMTTLAFSPLKFRVYAYHKWIGITVFLLACLRLAWRAGHPPPPAVPMPEWQRRTAAMSHAALYVLMLAIPLSGWIYSSATGISVVYLGLFTLPDLVDKDKALAAMLLVTHVTLNSVLVVLVTVHAGAALRHHLVAKDGLLTRMLPIRPRA